MSQQPKSQPEKGLKHSETNIPSTPSNKTLYLHNPHIGSSKQQNMKKTRLFLSPTSHPVVSSPNTSRNPQKRLQTTQTPRNKVLAPSQSKIHDENKALSPNDPKNGLQLLYVPTIDTKRRSSPKPQKIQENNRQPVKVHKKESDFSIVSYTTAAAKMKPDRASAETLKVREMMANRQVRGEEYGRKKLSQPQSGRLKTTTENEELISKKKEDQEDLGLELNLSPITRKKEDFSSFFSEREKPMCMKHPFKKAKYRAARQDGQRGNSVEEFYCSDCAIEFALKGIQMVKLPVFGSNSQLNTENDEKLEVIDHSNQSSKEIFNMSKDLLTKIDEAFEEAKQLEQKYNEQKELAEKKAESVEKTIQACSESVIMLFREETEKAVKLLTTELQEERKEFNKAFQNIKSLYKGLIDLKEGLKESAGRQTGFAFSAEEYLDQVNMFKNKIKQAPKSITKNEKSLFEDKVNEYKRSLKTVLKEVVMELEREDTSTTTVENNQTVMEKTDIYNEQMMKNLGDFEDFLKANEGHDALEMRIPRAKPAGNMVVSFGNKEIFDNILQSPAEAMTLCTTQGDTLGLHCDEMSGRFRLRDSRNCVTEEANYDNERKGGRDVEEYIKFMNYIGNQITAQRDRENSFQKSLFHSPQFKELAGNTNINNYYEY